MTIIWCMVLEISSVTDIFFCHLGLFFALLPPRPLQPRKSKSWRYYHFTHEKWGSELKIIWCMILEMWSATNKNFFLILANEKMTIIWYMVPGISTATEILFLSPSANFCPFTPLTAQKMKISKNKKNTWRYYLLHKCTKNYNILYCSGDMARDRCNFYFSFWSIFCLLTPVTAQKIKISRKWKKHLEISSFYTSVPKIMVICFTIPEIWHVTYVIVIFHFGLFFCAFTPLTSLKMKIKKKKKTPGDIIILHKCTKKHDHMPYFSWDMTCDRYNC